MAYPGIALVAMVGVGLGLALWYLLTDTTTNESFHGSGPPPRRDPPPPRRDTPPPRRDTPPPRRDTPPSNNSGEIPSDARRRRPRSNSKAKEDCPICTEPMDHKAAPVKCGHVFHLACIKKWRESQNGVPVTCPLCRQTI